MLWSSPLTQLICSGCRNRRGTLNNSFHTESRPRPVRVCLLLPGQFHQSCSPPATVSTHRTYHCAHQHRWPYRHARHVNIYGCHLGPRGVLRLARIRDCALQHQSHCCATKQRNSLLNQSPHFCASDGRLRSILRVCSEYSRYSRQRPQYPPRHSSPIPHITSRMGAFTHVSRQYLSRTRCGAW